MNAAHTSEVLKNGIGRVLDTWRDRFAGSDDLLHWVLRGKLADAGGARSAVPAPLAAEAARSASAIGAYFDNVRYTLLDPLTLVWGILTNALRVAAGVDSVTDAQRATFSFSAESLAAFFRAAHHDLKVADALWHAFKPMPAADCQVLAALFNVHMDARLDGATVVSLVRVLGNEGPLTREEEQALATLKNTGLAHAPFRGTRGGG